MSRRYMLYFFLAFTQTSRDHKNALQPPRRTSLDGEVLVYSFSFLPGRIIRAPDFVASFRGQPM